MNAVSFFTAGFRGENDVLANFGQLNERSKDLVAYSLSAQAAVAVDRIRSAVPVLSGVLGWSIAAKITARKDGGEAIVGPKRVRITITKRISKRGKESIGGTRLTRSGRTVRVRLRNSDVGRASSRVGQVVDPGKYSAFVDQGHAKGAGRAAAPAHPFFLAAVASLAGELQEVARDTIDGYFRNYNGAIYHPSAFAAVASIPSKARARAAPNYRAARDARIALAVRRFAISKAAVFAYHRLDALLKSRAAKMGGAPPAAAEHHSPEQQGLLARIRAGVERRVAERMNIGRGEKYEIFQRPGHPKGSIASHVLRSGEIGQKALDQVRARFKNEPKRPRRPFG